MNLSRNDLTPPAIPATPADSQPSSARHTGASEEMRAGLDHLTGGSQSMSDRTKDSPRWCNECRQWGDHHTDRHDPDRYKAHLESGLQSVVAANRELANHNLQEYRKLRNAAADLEAAVALIADMPLGGQYDYDAGYSERNAADAALAVFRRAIK